MADDAARIAQLEAEIAGCASARPRCVARGRAAAPSAGRGAGAADRHGRGPAGHRVLADRPASAVLDADRRARRPALRRGSTRSSSGVDGDHLRAWPAVGRAADGVSRAGAGSTHRSPRHAPPGGRSSSGGPSTSTTSTTSATEFPAGPALRRAPAATARMLVAPLLREGRRHRGDRRSYSDRGPAVHRARDRAAGDVRGPGGDRHRERPAVRGAGAAQRRASGEQSPGHRGAGAADRHRRDPAGDRLLADRPPAGAGGHRRERRAACARDRAVRSSSRDGR